jgi:hypothetical protein
MNNFPKKNENNIIQMKEIKKVLNENVDKSIKITTE